MALLVASSADDAEKFVHSVIDELCGRAGPRVATFGQTWSAAAWVEVLAATRALILQVSRCPVADIGPILEQAGVTGDHAKIVKAVLAVRAPELQKALVAQSCATGGAALVDIDWAVKVTQASDKLASMHVPRVAVSLVASQVVGGASHACQFELSHDELRALISTLESAQKQVRELSVPT